VAIGTLIDPVPVTGVLRRITLVDRGRLRSPETRPYFEALIRTMRTIRPMTTMRIDR
jgi:hypothetical protein